MFIQSNIEAMQSHLSLTRIDSRFNKSLAKISSGMALPKPSFGGGQFAVANDMEALYQEYMVGAANTQDAVGFLEVAQTTMMEVNDMILQANELAHRAASQLVNTDQRREMDMEFHQLKTNISDLLEEVRYNDISVYGAAGAARTLSVVFGEDKTFTISSIAVGSAATGFDAALHLSTQALASVAMSSMADAVNQISEAMAQMGAQINEVEGKVTILNEQAVQQKAMESRINELDYAKEMKNFTSLQVVLQGSNAMLTQANMKAQSVLQLFG